jgi:hypothetical protein
MADSKTERAEIKKMGGKPQRNSGRGQYQKGDAILGPFVVDVKESKMSFTFNKNVWAKICLDSARHRLEPALMVCIGHGSGSVRTWIIGDEMFHEMLSAWQDKYGDKND